MRVYAFVADTGRPVPPGPGVNLLNAGWTATAAIPLPGGGYTLPSQAVVIFVEADLPELNRLYTVTTELIDDNAQVARLASPEGEQAAHFEFPVIVPPVPGAPPSSPGRASVLLDLPAGSLLIENPRRWYSWVVSVGGQERARTGFWVEAFQTPPVMGRPVGAG